jgi:hypothetical protein
MIVAADEERIVKMPRRGLIAVAEILQRTD